ncbi:MAG: hypothetical protein JWM41_4529 [Gemmatimonadetes bacterium]|nr:hypothetical protein [Gemmatimonadota bacterium]
MKRWCLMIALLVAGCRERPKSAGEGPYADQVAADVPLIEKALGVKFKTPPKLEIRSREQVREFLLQKLREPDVQKQITNQQETFKVLGMLPDTFHLADFFVRVLTEQIIGYYDPKTKVLYVVKDAPDDLAGITVMHELVHALQDQYMNLDSLEHITGDDDRAAAVQAVIEGQATYEQVYIMAGGSGNVAAQLPGGWESMRTTLRDAQRTQPVFSSAPMVIQETLLFPYINGAEFIRRYKALHKAQLPIDTFPVSTEQLMHDSAYFSKHPDVPSIVTLPPVASSVDQNDFGEFGTRLFLFQHTKDQDRSIRASNGWDGDRYALVKVGDTGRGLAWATVWDTPLDAAEFMSAVDDVMLKRFNVKPRITGELRHFDTAKRTVEVNVREISGRPVVLYVDVPAGASTNILDFSKVKVTPR